MKRKSEDFKEELPGQEVQKKVEIEYDPNTPAFKEQMKKLLQEKNLKDLLKLCQKDLNKYKEYKKLKFKNHVYQVDDILLISNAEDIENDFIGKLLKVIRIEDEKVLALIEIQWYYKKTDLPLPKFNNIIDSISDSEVFLTDHIDCTFVDCINGDCTIMNYDDYDQLQSIPPNTYFMRAKYETSKKKLNPPFEKWKKGCICQRPLNPDLLYIQCDICNKWLHITCVGLNQDEVAKIEKYVCIFCKDKKIKEN